MENRRNPTFQYFGGSVAEPMEWSIPEAPGRTAPKARGWEITIDLVGLAGLVMSVVLALCMLAGGLRYYEAAQLRNAAQEQVTELRQEQAELREIYEAGFDPEQIRQAATSLGMIPMEQARTVPIEAPAVQEELTFWQWLGDFFTDLFA